MNFQTNIKHTKYRIHETKCRISKLFNTFNKLHFVPHMKFESSTLYVKLTVSILGLAQQHQIHY